MAARRKKLEAEYVRITPAMAKEMLKQNFSNRRLSERAIKLYARDMVRGHWDGENGETVKFAADGCLLDGQHRLHAIIMAGVPVEMLVVTGLKRTAQKTMDVGRKRNASDTFMLDGESNTTILSAVLKRVALWDEGHRRRFREPVSNADLAALLEARPEIRRSVDIASRTHRAFKLLPGSAMGTTHHLLSRIDMEKATWFFGKIETPSDLAQDHPVFILRERAVRDIGLQKRVDDVRAMTYIIKCWNYYRKGESMERIQVTKDAPIPDPE